MITQFKIFENHTTLCYLDVFPGNCPVCATKGKLADKEEFGEYDGEYTFKCPLCSFWWKQEYYIEGEGCEVLSHEMTDFNGDNIEDGFEIDPSLYDEMVLQAKKYNI